MKDQIRIELAQLEKLLCLRLVYRGSSEPIN